MAQFREISTGEGNYFYKHGAAGMYVVEFTGISEAPDYRPPKGDPSPQLAWDFLLFDVQGEPVIDANFEDEDGATVPQQAVVSRLTSEATGPKSNAAKFIEALLGRQIVREGDEADSISDLLEECVGLKAIVNFTINGAWNDGSPRAQMQGLATFVE